MMNSIAMITRSSFSIGFGTGQTIYANGFGAPSFKPSVPSSANFDDLAQDVRAFQDVLEA
jgi:hypothetical protein